MVTQFTQQSLAELVKVIKSLTSPVYWLLAARLKPLVRRASLM